MLLEKQCDLGVLQELGIPQIHPAPQGSLITPVIPQGC